MSLGVPQREANDNVLKTRNYPVLDHREEKVHANNWGQFEHHHFRGEEETKYLHTLTAFSTSMPKGQQWKWTRIWKQATHIWQQTKNNPILQAIPFLLRNHSCFQDVKFLSSDTLWSPLYSLVQILKKIRSGSDTEENRKRCESMRLAEIKWHPHIVKKSKIRVEL